jgi:hypothetical protein
VKTCDCARSYLCARHRLANAELSALARNFTITDEQWHQAVARLEVDDLHRLLEEQP